MLQGALGTSLGQAGLPGTSLMLAPNGLLSPYIMSNGTSTALNPATISILKGHGQLPAGASLPTAQQLQLLQLAGLPGQGQQLQAAGLAGGLGNIAVLGTWPMRLAWQDCITSPYSCCVDMSPSHSCRH
jgi:hypothetical protein